MTFFVFVCRKPQRNFIGLILLIVAFASCVLGEEPGSRLTLSIPAAKAVKIDGVLAPGEWGRAGSLEISVHAGWAVRVQFQHDSKNLYFAFEGLQHGKEMRFPELMIDTHRSRSADWQKGEFWFHSSFNLCDGEGEYNVYERNKIFQCGKAKKGWSANHFPLGPPSVMEIQVSFDRLRIQPTKGLSLGFAIDLTDTQKNWTFWPADAQLAHPSSWGTIRLE